MKWGRKKPSSSSSSSSSSLFSRVLPTAWLSKFKRMSIDSETKSEKSKQKGTRNNSVSMSSSRFAAAFAGGGGGGVGSGGGGDGEDFWKLSFGEDHSVDGKTSRSVSRSAWYDSDEELEFAVHSNCRSRHGSNARMVKACDTQILPDMNMNMYKGEKTAVIKTPRMRMINAKELKLKKTNIEEKKLKRSGENNRAVPIINGRDNHRKHRHLYSNDYAFTTAQKLAETEVFSPENFSSEEGKRKEEKIEKLKVKNEKQRKSVYMSRELPRRRKKQSNNNSNKVRVYSPRTASSRAEICKIRAIEDMKKARAKVKAASEMSKLEDFAMVKCSFDPEKDFRDSMMEMIIVKKISEPEELEELLACYLTLNSDVYHDLIVKVFQQVWLHLDRPCSDTDLQDEQCYRD